MTLRTVSLLGILGSALLLLASSCGGSSSDQKGSVGSSPGGNAGNPGGGMGPGGTNPGGGTEAGASGGQSGMSGSSGSGGSAAQGGSDEPLAGNGGQGGEPPTPVGQVATLGDPCDTPAELACAGNHQKVTLICSEGEWVVNQTCGGGEFCNSTPGPDVGLCAPEIEECAGLEPGTRFCDSGDLLECGPDNMTTPLVESCELGCYAGHCAEPGYEPDPCPNPPAWMNCADDCGGPIQDCASYMCTPSYLETYAVPGSVWSDGDTSATVFRIDVPPEPCTCGDGVELAARISFGCSSRTADGKQSDFDRLARAS